MKIFATAAAAAVALATLAASAPASAQQIIGFDPQVGQICAGPLGPGPCPLVWAWIQAHQVPVFNQGPFNQGPFNQGSFNQGSFPAPVPAPAPRPAPAPQNSGPNLPQLPTLDQDIKIAGLICAFACE